MWVPLVGFRGLLLHMCASMMPRPCISYEIVPEGCVLESISSLSLRGRVRSSARNPFRDGCSCP
eukprot:jgi/Botrbrau1/6458/Bobra.0034s0033.1